MRRSMLSSLALLALCVSVSFGQVIKDPAEVMPARVLGYGEVRQPGLLLKEIASLFENSALGNLPDSLFKFMEDLKVPPPQRGFQEMAAGLLLAPEIVKEAQRLQGVGAAITGIDEHGQPEFIVVGLPGESNLPRLVFRAMLTMERVKPTGTVEGVTLYRMFRRDGKETTEHGPALAMTADALIVGSPKLVKEVIERLKGKNKEAALASVEKFREARQQVGSEPGLFAFADVTQVFDLIGKVAPLGDAEKQVLKLVGSVKAQAYGLTLEKGTLHLREVVLVDPKAKDSFLELFPSEPVKRELLHFTPDGAMLALAISNADGAKRWTRMLELADQIAKSARVDKVPSEEIGNVMKALDIDLGKDVLGRIQGLAVALGDLSKAPIRRIDEKGPDFERHVQYPEVPGVVVIEATDEDAAKKLLEDVLPKVYGAIHHTKDVKATTKQVQGQKVHTLPGNKYVSLNYGRQGRTIVLGAFPAPVAQALNNGAKKHGLLADEKVAAHLKGVEGPLVLGVVKPMSLLKASLMVSISGGGSSRKEAPRPEKKEPRPERRRSTAVEEKPAVAQGEEGPGKALEKEFDRLQKNEGLIVLTLIRKRDRVIEEITWTGLKPALGQATDLALKLYMLRAGSKKEGKQPAPKEGGDGKSK